MFKIADDNGLLLLDLKDLRSNAPSWATIAAEFKTQYGQRLRRSAYRRPSSAALLELESKGGGLLRRPALDLDDLHAEPMLKGPRRHQHPGGGQAHQKRPQALRHSSCCGCCRSSSSACPRWAILEKPKLAFFFDEAHLLFNDAPPTPLLDKIEQVVRLVRSKGVGVYFVSSESRSTSLEKVLGQLGNRVQHALRAYTPRDQKAVKTAANLRLQSQT